MSTMFLHQVIAVRANIFYEKKILENKIITSSYIAYKADSNKLIENICRQHLKIQLVLQNDNLFGEHEGGLK